MYYMHYYAVRYPSAPDQARIEKADDQFHAMRQAFGPYTRYTQWEWKDLGTTVDVIRSDRKRIAALTSKDGWHREGPKETSDDDEVQSREHEGQQADRSGSDGDTGEVR